MNLITFITYYSMGFCFDIGLASSEKQAIIETSIAIHLLM